MWLSWRSQMVEHHIDNPPPHRTSEEQRTTSTSFPPPEIWLSPVCTTHVSRPRPSQQKSLTTPPSSWQRTVFPNIEQLPVYLKDVRALGKDTLVPSCVVRLVRSKGFKPELIYWDDGSVLSYMTVAAVDPYNNVLINGAVLQYGGFAVCELPKESPF